MNRPYVPVSMIRARIGAIDHGSEWLRHIRGFPRPTLRQIDEHLFTANRPD